MTRAYSRPLLGKTIARNLDPEIFKNILIKNC